MQAKDSLQNNKNPNRSHRFSDHTMVYIDLTAIGLGRCAKICQIGAHFAESSFSRYVSTIATLGEKAANKCKLSEKDGVFYFRGEQVEIVSKEDAWNDFLKFLLSANNSVVLVTHHKLNDCSLLFRDLSELSLMDEFRKVCVGVIDTLPLCRIIFSGEKETGHKFKLKLLLQEKLGEENLSGGYNAAVNAVNLEKLMKHAKVEPKIFQQHFLSLSEIENQVNRQARLQRKRAERAARCRMSRITFSENKRSPLVSGEDSSASLLSGRVKASKPEANRRKTCAITPEVSKQVAAKKMTTKNILHKNEDPKGSNLFRDYTMVYFHLAITGLQFDGEVYQIGAYFAEKSFSRYVCPIAPFTQTIGKLTKLAKGDDGALYLRGQRVHTVSKMDAWKDFLKFLQSANKCVVLVTHQKQNDYSFLLRDLSGLSLMGEFRRVCVGVIDALRVCIKIFPGRTEIGKGYKLKELVKDKLGEERSSLGYNAAIDAINLGKLMELAKVEPEIFQQHFSPLSSVRRKKKEQARLRRRTPRGGSTLNENKRCPIESAEDSGASLLTSKGKASKPVANGKKTSAITPDVSKQVAAKKLTTKDILQNKENPHGSHTLCYYSLVYFSLKTSSRLLEGDVIQIGAHFAENSFSKYVCPIQKIKKSTKRESKFSKRDGILYSRGQRVETVSKMDAWKDFLKFLQSANNSVVLVTHQQIKDCSLLLRDLSELSLMEEFTKICVGVIDAACVCKKIFPGRNEIGKGYKLKALVKDVLGEEPSLVGYNATIDAIYLGALMKQAKVEPEIFQQYVTSLSSIKSRITSVTELIREKRARSEIKRGSIQSAEDGGASPLSGRGKATKPVASGKKTSAVTPDVSKQGEKMTTRDGLQNYENPLGSHHISDHTLVYFDLEGTGSRMYSDVCQIGAHFAENSFSRYVCPVKNFTMAASKVTGFSKKNGILYLRGERVETVSKRDAWKDFLKFLQSANNTVILVMHDRGSDCFLLFRDLSEHSLMEKFRELCVGVIDTLPLLRDIFPGRDKIGKNYRLADVVQEKLGEETSEGSHNAIVDAINLGKLMKHANVQPEVFQHHFFSLLSLENWYQTIREARLLKNKFPFMTLRGAKRMTEAGVTYNDLRRSFISGGEGGIASFLSSKISKCGPKVIRERTKAITQVFTKSGVGRGVRKVGNLEGNSEWSFSDNRGGVRKIGNLKGNSRWSFSDIRGGVRKVGNIEVNSHQRWFSYL